MHIFAFCHVEDVARNQQAIEAVQVEEAEESVPGVAAAGVRGC